MSKILTGYNLDFIATHIQEIDKYNRGIYFCFDTKDNGTEGFRILNAVLPVTTSGYGIDKRDFTLKFGSVDKRDEIYTELSKEVNDYRQSHPEATDPYYNNPVNPGAGGNSGNGNDVKKSTNWTTYLIIGAAVVAVIMLLWDRKKKK